MQYSPSLERATITFFLLFECQLLLSFTFPFFFFFFSYLNPVSPRILLALKYTQDSSFYQPHCYSPPPLPRSPRSKALSLQLDGCSSLIGLPAFFPSFSARCCMYMLCELDAYVKPICSWMIPLPEAYQRLPPRMKTNLPVLCKACSSPVFSSVYSQPHFPSDLRHCASRSPGPAVPSGGHLACTPHIASWLLFRYRFNSGASSNTWRENTCTISLPPPLYSSPAFKCFSPLHLSPCIIFTLYVLYLHYM